jgi:hypothetical protein
MGDVKEIHAFEKGFSSSTHMQMDCSDTIFPVFVTSRDSNPAESPLSSLPSASP